VALEKHEGLPGDIVIGLGAQQRAQLGRVFAGRVDGVNAPQGGMDCDAVVVTVNFYACVGCWIESVGQMPRGPVKRIGEDEVHRQAVVRGGSGTAGLVAVRGEVGGTVGQDDIRPHEQVVVGVDSPCVLGRGAPLAESTDGFDDNLAQVGVEACGVCGKPARKRSNNGPARATRGGSATRRLAWGARHGARTWRGRRA